jgi:penicillin-binding protein 1A
VAAPSGYFVDVVKAQAEAAGIPVTAGGYKVYTTLEPALQRAAVTALVEGAAAVEQRPGYRNATYDKHPKGSTDYLQGLAIAIDPSSGDVKALVGGRNYQESQFNRAVNGMRQPGSSFKPIVYARAIGDSIPPTTIVPDTNVHVMFDRQDYSPKNSDGLFLGDITLREAITRSRNPVAVQLWLKSGADSVIALARRLGISTPIAPYPASAIGASEVEPLTFVAAYTAFANLGTPVEPRFVYRVDDAAGKTVWGQPIRMRPPAMGAAATFVVRDMMRDVVERGTATVIRKYLAPNVPVAGKTGTTDDNADVWFVGLTPEIVGGVWLGMDTRKPIAERGVAGGTLAAPIWAQMMARGGYARPSSAWAMPEGVVSAEVDRATGALASPATPAERRYVEYFLAGTEPGALRVDARRLFTLGPIVF